MQWLCLIALLILGACRSTESSDTKGISERIKNAHPNYGKARNLKLGEEYIPTGERLYFQKAAYQFHKVHLKQQEQNSKRDQRHLRGMHAKGHACYNATFQATTNQSRFKEGLFADQTPLKAVVRFSNGSGILQPDPEKDLRGLAVKVYSDSIGKNKWAAEDNVQDFLMTNAPVHHAKDIVELMEFIQAFSDGGTSKAAFLASHPILTATLLRQTGRKVTSLLNESYWSRSAFKLSERQTMQYFVSPCQKVRPFTFSGENYLKTELVAQMSQRESFCYKMFVRLQTDPQKEPIENHTKEWKSKAYEVAKITLEGGRALPKEECHKLVFTPWNRHPAHKPLGNFNRARYHIYKAAAKFRFKK